MKIFLLLLTTVCCLQQNIFSQNIGINATGAVPHASAMLDISDTSKGILIPRMSTAQRTTISSPAKGLMVFDNTSNNFWFYNGSAWLQLGGSAVINSGWGLSGNQGTRADSNFIGTTDTQSLRIRVNNNWAGAIHPTNGNLFLGMNAGKIITNGNFNTGIGNYALATNTTGLYNAAFGSNALLSNTSGGSNVAIGAGAMYGNTSGLYNTAVGSTALYYSNKGENNTAIGAEALYNDSTGSNNTAVGYQALTRSNGKDNTATGANALLNNTSGALNTATGGYALQSNTVGNFNTANGNTALYLNTTGNQNTAVGQSALYSNTTGHDNTAIGIGALDLNVNGYYNIALGASAGTASYAANTFNTISIGNYDYLNGYQNQVIIGSTSTAWIGGKVTWSTFSDARIKNTIAEDVKGLDFILKLRPVTYHISNKAIIKLSGNKETPDFPGKYDNEKIKYSGFLAQEVEKAAQASHYDFSGYAAPKNQYQLYTLSYEQFVVPLVKAMQEQQKMIEELKNRLAVLENNRVAK